MPVNLRSTGHACCALPWVQCADNCDSCNAKGAGLCDAGGCTGGYGITANGTCAAVRASLQLVAPPRAAAPTCSQTAHALWHASCELHGCMRVSAASSPSALCVPGPQCVENCSHCDTAGAGKCDACSGGFGLTSEGTCDVVRPCSTWAACLHAPCSRARLLANCACAWRAAFHRACLLCAPWVQCADNCDSCNTKGAGLCDAGGCTDGYGITANGTCAAVRASLQLVAPPRAAAPTCSQTAHALWHASCELHGCMRVSAASSPSALCVPGPQCVENCSHCDTAGAGKCDPGQCNWGFLWASNGTCDVVSLCSSWAAMLACMALPCACG